MNKNIKRIVALTLAVGTVSVTVPSGNYNLLATKAYASSRDADEVKGLIIKDHDGKQLDLYTDSSHTKLSNGNFDEGDTYYVATATTSASVRIDTVSGPDDDNVRIFRGSDDHDYEIGDSISLTDSTTTLKVRVYKKDYDDDKHYSSSDYDQYEIKVRYDGASKNLHDNDNDDDDDDDDNDDDYLDTLELSDGSGSEIKLYEDSNYNDKLDNDDLDDDDEGDTYYAKTSAKTVKVETSGPDDDYVRVFKSTNNSAKGIETGDEISVSEDKTLTVRIYDEEPDDDIEYDDDNDVIGEYKIKLQYTGNNSDSTNNTNGQAAVVTNNSILKPNQWVQVNGYWQYNDSLGNPLKNQWYFDGYYGKWYYLGFNGVMSTNSWILTGGKYYYVSSDGGMVTNTTINGYRIGSDGAWIQ